MYIKRNIIFELENRKKNGVPIVENVPIRMRVTYNGKRVEFTTGYRIDVRKWDAEKQKVRNGYTNKLKQSSSDINADLLELQSKLQNVFKEFEVQNTIPSPAQLKEAFNSRIKNNKVREEQPKMRLFEAFDEFIKEASSQNHWANNTRKKFVTIKNHIKEFKEDIVFEHFDEQGLNEYITFLIDEKEMQNNTISREIRFIKEVLQWGFRKGYYHNNAFKAFKPRLKIPNNIVIFLSNEELQKLCSYEIPKDKQYLKRVRDVLLFCCFTGLRYSDVYNLKRSDIKSDHIEIITQKTTDSLIIELNDVSRTILNKYKDFHFPDDKVLPVISNQKMNKYLKELGKLAGINEEVRMTYCQGNKRTDEVKPKYKLLCTHTGRRTFICNALLRDIPAHIVMKWTGHSDYRSMQPYIDVTDKIRSQYMKKMNSNTNKILNEILNDKYKKVISDI